MWRVIRTSFIATVDKALKEVVVELGVPLYESELGILAGKLWRSYGPMSEGVTGSDGGGGRLIRVGVVILSVVFVKKNVRLCCG
jgi:hypothetical protein